MGLHTDLEIHKTAYDLFDLVVDDLVRNMPKDVKRALGDKLRDECLDLTVHIQIANMERDKAPHLLNLIRGLGKVKVMLRLSRDRRYIGTRKYAAATFLTTSIGKQANAWRKAMSPAA